eukprot:g18575.t1
MPWPMVVREAIRPLFPESDVCGFVSGELEGSRKLDKQLEKAAIRSIAEILVTSCGFKFRRSAFRGHAGALRRGSPSRARGLLVGPSGSACERAPAGAGLDLVSLLVIYFLQVCPRVLPPLTAFMTFQQLSSKGSASSPDDAPRPEPNPVHTSKLFKDFMHFYQDFDWRSCLLQDPFRPLNLGRRISTSSFARTQEEFARAGAICAEGVAVGRIFELWVMQRKIERAESQQFAAAVSMKWCGCVRSIDH